MEQLNKAGQLEATHVNNTIVGLLLREGEGLFNILVVDSQGPAAHVNSAGGLVGKHQKEAWRTSSTRATVYNKIATTFINVDVLDRDVTRFGGLPAASPVSTCNIHQHNQP